MAFGTLPARLDVDTLLSAVSDFVLALDRDGVYLWAAATNPTSVREGLRETAQRRARWLVGKSLYDVFSEEEAKRLHEIVLRAIESGEKQDVEYSVEPWKEGRRWFEAAITRLSDETVLWAARDVTDLKRTRDDLALWHERRMTLINSVDAILWEADLPFSHFTFVSEQAVRLLGYPLERWLEEPGFWTSHMHPEDASWCPTFCEEKATRGEAHDFEYRMIAADGRVVWLRDIVNVVMKDGKPESLRGVMVDITSFKDAQRQLSQQEEQYRAIFEATSDGLIINDLETGVVLEANPAACRMHGYDDMVGVHPTQFIHPDSHHLFHEYVRIAREGGQFRARAQDMRRDGSIIDVEVLGRGLVYNGQPAVLGVVRDVTEQTRQEEALREAFVSLSEREQQYRSVFEASSDSLLVHSFKEGYPVVAANPAACEMWGYGEEEILGVTVAEMIPDRASTEPFATSVMETGSGHMRSTGRRKDGSTFDLDAAGTMFTLGGQPHLLFIQRDVTEQVRSEQVLEEKVEQRTREIETLLKVSQAASSTLDMTSLLEVVMEQLRSVVPCSGSSIGVMEGGSLLTLASRVAPGRKTGDAALGRPIPLPKMSGLLDAFASQGEVIVRNVRSDEAMAIAYREAVGDLLTEDALAHICSWMAVPLVHKDEAIGMLSVSSGEEGFYTPEHAKLARAVASQVASAIANARLFERVQQRSRELESLLEVSRGVASILERDQLVQLILRQLGEIVNYGAASLILLEGDEFVVFDSRGTADDAEAIGLRFPADATDDLWRSLELQSVSARYPCVQAASEPDFWSVISRGGHVIVADAAAGMMAGEDALAGKLASGSAFSSVRSWMAVPLALQDRVIGYLGVANEEPGYFTEKHAQVARAFAAHAAIAIDNARLYELEQERSRELATLLDVSRHVTSTLDLEELLKVVLSSARDVMVFDRASLSVLDGDWLQVLSLFGTAEATRGLSRGEQISTKAAGALWEALSKGQPMVIEDVNDGSKMSELYRAAVPRGSEGVCSWMGVPLMVRDDVIGMLGLARCECDPFTEEDARLMRAFADQSALAIENARLYARGQRLAVVEERQRLARELHDSVSQALYGIGLGARTARSLVDKDGEKLIEPLEYVLQLAEAGLAEMRALIFDLRPESLEEEGLISAIERHLRVVEMRHEIPVKTEFGPEPEAPVETKEAVYRIVRESLHNVIKHARATHVHLILKTEEDVITFRIDDDGAGFDPEGEFPGHMGLISMRERAAGCGGRLEIRSEPGRGTTVEGFVPVGR